MWKTVTRLSLICLVPAMLSSAAKADDELKPADLVGVYDIVSGEKYGVEEPEDRIEGSTVRFTEDRVVVVDKEENEVYGATYKLEPGDLESHEKATVIKMVSKLAEAEDEVSYGLIDKKDDKVRLIYALPGAMRPSDFKTKDKQLMFVMKKRANNDGND